MAIRNLKRYTKGKKVARDSEHKIHWENYHINSQIVERIRENPSDKRAGREVEKQRKVGRKAKKEGEGKSQDSNKKDKLTLKYLYTGAS